MGYPNMMSASLASERTGFIAKVYSYFLGSLFVAGVGVAAGGAIPQGLSFVPWLGSLVMLFITYAVRRTEGVNMAALFTFTFFSGLSIGPLIHALGMMGLMHVVYTALGITAGAFMGLTLYVFIAKHDFSWLGAFLWPALLGMVFVGLFSMFWPMSRGADLVYCYMGVLLFIGYVLYDTSVILTRYPDDEYVAGAITLYLDFLNLFLYILRILLSKDRD